MDTARVNSVIGGSAEAEKLDIGKERLNLALFSAGKLVSLLGTYIYSFAISLYILKVTGSGTSFAFSILLGTLPRVLLGPLAGSVADRVNRRLLIVGLDFLSGLVVLGLAGLSFIYGLQLPFIYTANLFLAVISTFFNTAFSAAVPSLVSDQKLIRINSYSRAIDSGSAIAGPVLGGMVFGIVSMNLFLLINGISFILSGISELFIDFDFNKSKEDGKPRGRLSAGTIWQDMKEVFVFIKSDPLLRMLMPFSISFNFLFTALLSVALPFLINNVLGMTSMQYGMIEGAFSVGMLIAAIIIGRLPEQKKKRKSLLLCIGGMGICIILMGIPGLELLRGLGVQLLFGGYMAVVVIFSMFLLLMDMPLTVVIQRTIPKDMLGRVWGALGTISASLTPLGVLLAGMSLDWLPPYALFFLTGIYLMAAAAVLYRKKELQEY